MALTAWLRSLGVLAFALVPLTCAAQAQFPLVLEPKVVEVASSVTLTVTSNGAFNLSGITARQVRVIPQSPEDFVHEDIFTEKVDATARRLTVTLTVPDRRRTGERVMDIDFGGATVSLKFTLVPAFFGCPASCRAPFMCAGKDCVLPKSKCNPRCKPPTPICNEESNRCEKAR